LFINFNFNLFFFRYHAKLAKKDAEKDLIAQLSNLNISDDPFIPLNINNSDPNLSEILQETFSQIGISISQVDRRIYLDTLFEIINIQKILFHEILFIIQEISKTLVVKIENSINVDEIWKKFAEKLQLSIQKHLIIIKEVAESTHYGRHLLLVNIEILEFHLKILKYQFRYPPNGSSVVDITLQTKIKENCEKILEGISDILRSDGYQSAEKTFKSGIHERLENLSRNCKEVKICAENLGKPLSNEEKLEIHRAMKTEFKRSGMFKILNSIFNIWN